jgi:hypothetical protein
MTNSVSEAMPDREPSRIPEKRTALDLYYYSRLKFFFLRNRQRMEIACGPSTI